MKNILLIAAMAAAAPNLAIAANVIPYDAQYSVTAGADDRSPQIGTAHQRLADGCTQRSFDRDIVVSLALTQSLRYDVNSKLHADEARNGRKLSYKLDRTMNGEASQRSGQVVLGAAGGKAMLNTPNGPKDIDLQAGILLPQAMIEAILDHLQVGETQFTIEAFDTEVVSNRVEVSVQRVAPGEVPIRAQDTALIARIGAPSYPIMVNFSRSSGKPLFTAHVLLHANGVISRMIASFGPFTVAANLTSFTPLPQLRCAPPIKADN